MSKTVNIPLNDFQHWMQQLLLDPYQQTDVEPSNILTKSSSASSIEEVICHSEKLSAQQHLAIYQRSYIARLRNCMSQQFSALEYALGEEIFCGFADDYLATYPSKNYNLAFLGANFANYLQETRPDAHEDLKEDWIDFMIELAQFEYALGVILEQKANENFVLATKETTEDKLKLIPIFELFKFQFPVREFYSDFKNGNQPSLPSNSESYCVVLRYHYKLAIYDLNKAQYEFLKILKKEKSTLIAKLHFASLHKEENFEFENVWETWKARWIAANFFACD